MKIHHRIHARKVILAYLYRHSFTKSLVEDHQLILEQIIELSQWIEQSKKSRQESVAALQESIQETTQWDMVDKVDYLIRNCFDNRWYEEIDVEFVLAIIAEYPKFKKDVAERVNKYATSFSFEQMDMIDQSIFLLGYTEFKKIGTPKEVLLNEMVELSKRYGDEWSSKLVNWILHQMIGDLETEAWGKPVWKNQISTRDKNKKD